MSVTVRSGPAQWRCPVCLPTEPAVERAFLSLGAESFGLTFEQPTEEVPPVSWQAEGGPAHRFARLLALISLTFLASCLRRMPSSTVLMASFSAGSRRSAASKCSLKSSEGSRSSSAKSS